MKRNCKFKLNLLNLFLMNLIDFVKHIYSFIIYLFYPFYLISIITLFLPFVPCIFQGFAFIHKKFRNRKKLVYLGWLQIVILPQLEVGFMVNHFLNFHYSSCLQQLGLTNFQEFAVQRQVRL